MQITSKQKHLLGLPTGFCVKEWGRCVFRYSLGRVHLFLWSSPFFFLAGLVKCFRSEDAVDSDMIDFLWKVPNKTLALILVFYYALQKGWGMLMDQWHQWREISSRICVWLSLFFLSFFLPFFLSFSLSLSHTHTRALTTPQLYSVNWVWNGPMLFGDSQAKISRFLEREWTGGWNTNKWLFQRSCFQVRKPASQSSYWKPAAGSE